MVEEQQRWDSDEMRDVFETLLEMQTVDEVRRFLRDLCTIRELEAIAQRWQVARLVSEHVPYQEISRRTGASTATVTRVAHWLNHGEGGYTLGLERRPTRRRPA